MFLQLAGDTTSRRYLAMSSHLIMDRLRDQLNPDMAAVACLVVATVVGLLLATNDGPGMCNDVSRLAAADSLANRSTFVIDGSYFSYTCDKIKIGEHFFSDKPPLQSLYLAGLLKTVQTTTDWTIAADLDSIYMVLTLFSSGLAFLLTILGVYRFERQFEVAPSWSAVAAVGACAGTLMLPFSTTISSHAAAAPCLVWLAVLIVGQRRRATPLGARRALAMGVLAGVGATVEPLSVAFSGPLLIASASFGQNRAKLGWIVAGGLVALIPHMAINYAISGNPLLANLDPQNFEFAGSMHTKHNLSGVGWAHPNLAALATYAYHCLVGYRGAVVYNPPAALGGICLVALALGVGKLDAHRRIFAALLVGIAAFFVLTIGFSNNYSGWSYGIRWQATPAPLIGAAAGILVGRLDGRIRRWVASGLVATTVAGATLAGLGTLEPWTPSTNEQYSFVEVLSDKPVYVQTLLDRAKYLGDTQRWAASRHMAEQVLRRSPAAAGGWVLAIAASERLGDTDRLRAYRRRLTGRPAGLPEAFRTRAIAQIDIVLES